MERIEQWNTNTADVLNTKIFNPNIHPCYTSDMNKQNWRPAVKYKKCISILGMKLKANHMLQHRFFKQLSPKPSFSW